MVQNSDFFKHISGLAEPGGYRLDFIDRGAYVAQLTPPCSFRQGRFADKL
jgi:hypothetical protein